MKILFVTARLCQPLNNGAKIRAFHIMRALAREHDVTVVSYYGSVDEERYFSGFEELGIKLIPVFNPSIDSPPAISALCRCFLANEPITVAKYYSKKMVEQIRYILADKYDVIHCEHLHVFPMLSGFGLPVVLDAHNVESQIAGRYAAIESNPLKKFILDWNSRKMDMFEKEAVNSASMVLAVSDQDRLAFENMKAVDKVMVVENGVDVEYFRPSNTEENKSIAFVGSMDWKPNIDGVVYFLDVIFPLIRKKHPDVSFYIVGKNPSESLKRKGCEIRNVTITGTVDDVRPYMVKASVCIVPLLVGGGTRLKVMEAFSMEKAVVSTALGCEGIECRNGEHIVIADTPDSFADAVSTLLANTSLRRELGIKARKLVEQMYCWDALGQKMNGHYQDMFKRSNL